MLRDKTLHKVDRLNFNRGFENKSSAVKVGVVIANPAVDPRVEEARVKSILDAMNQSELEQVYLCNIEGRWKSEVPAELSANLDNVLSRHPNAYVVVCPSSQYHITAHHIRRFLKKAMCSSNSTIYDFKKTDFLYYMGLQFAFAVLSPNTPGIRKFRMNRLHFNARESAFLSDEGVQFLEISDEDIQEAYGVFTQTEIPTSITIELNNSCNSSCWYCPFHGENPYDPLYVREKQNMSLSDFERLVGEVAQWRSDYMISQKTINPFWRGEFFLYPKWREALQIIRHYELRSVVISNGTVLDYETIEQILQEKLLNHLTITLDAVSPGEHYRTRGNKSFERIVDNIEYFIRKRREYGIDITFGLNHDLTEENRKSIEEYVRTWAERVDYILMGPIHSRRKDSLQGFFNKQLHIFDLKDLSMRRVPCTALIRNIEIDCNLNLHLCAPCGGHRISIGNLKDAGICETLEKSGLYQKVLSSHRKGTYLESDYCRDCSMWEFNFVAERSLVGFKVISNPNSWLIYPNKKVSKVRRVFGYSAAHVVGWLKSISASVIRGVSRRGGIVKQGSLTGPLSCEDERRQGD